MQMNLFKKIASEMIRHGFTTVHGRTHYSHPSASLFGRVTMRHSNAKLNSEGVYKYPGAELTKEIRLFELASELRRRFHQDPERNIYFREAFRNWLSFKANRFQTTQVEHQQEAVA